MKFPRFIRRSRMPAVALLVAGTLGACAVGPDFRAPTSPARDDQPYGAATQPGQTVATPGAAGASQRFVSAQDIPEQWWTLFRSAPLDALIRSALERSPSLAAAQAALRQAQENFNAEYGSLALPAVNGSLSAGRERVINSATGKPGVYNLYNASVNVSYTLDLFGATRRELEAYAASVDYQRYQVEAANLALSANLVTTAIAEASLRGQLQATREVLAAQDKQLDLLTRQLQLGAVTRATVLAQSTQVATTRATLAPLEKALQQTRHQLAVYAGRLPGDADLPEFTLDALQLPLDLPVSLPSALVRQRPDIRASEALLHAASAQVGVATANQYPQVTLSGSFGSQSTHPSDLFSSATTVWSLVGGLTQPIFNGGALAARQRAAQAAYEQADAQYRDVVLKAFQNVADALRALDADAVTLGARDDVARQAQQLLDLSTRQYQLGAVSYLALLDAQRTAQQARVNLVQAQAARQADTAALFQALGGGWWNRREPLADARPQPGVAP